MNVKLPQGVLDRLNGYARAHDRKRDDIIVAALQAWFRKEERKDERRAVEDGE